MQQEQHSHICQLDKAYVATLTDGISHLGTIGLILFSLLLLYTFYLSIKTRYLRYIVTFLLFLSFFSVAIVYFAELRFCPQFELARRMK